MRASDNFRCIFRAILGLDIYKSLFETYLTFSLMRLLACLPSYLLSPLQLRTSSASHPAEEIGFQFLASGLEKR